MKSKANQRRSLTTFAVAFALTVGGGYAIYRSLFMPKVHVKHVAQTWMDHSAGKSVHPVHHKAMHVSNGNHRPLVLSCHKPMSSSSANNYARHTKKHKHKKKHIAANSHLHNGSGSGYHYTSYNNGN